MNFSPGAQVVDDLHLMAGLHRRDAAAMAELYDRYGRIVYSVAYRILGEAGHAEDTVQETFLRVWNRAHLIDQSRSSLGPWLVTIARNVSIDCLRAARQARGESPDRSGRSGGDWRMQQAPSDSLACQISSEVSINIARSRAFLELSLEQQQVIEFAYFEGLTQAEISERMGRPLGTVKTWVRTALVILRREMAHHALADPKPVTSSARTFIGTSSPDGRRDGHAEASSEHGAI